MPLLTPQRNESKRERKETFNFGEYYYFDTRNIPKFVFHAIHGFQLKHIHNTKLKRILRDGKIHPIIRWIVHIGWVFVYKMPAYTIIPKATSH